MPGGESLDESTCCAAQRAHSGAQRLGSSGKGVGNSIALSWLKCHPQTDTLEMVGDLMWIRALPWRGRKYWRCGAGPEVFCTDEFKGYPRGLAKFSRRMWELCKKNPTERVSWMWGR